MDHTCIVGGDSRRRIAPPLRSLVCRVVLVLGLLGFAPVVPAAAGDSCSPEVLDAQLHGLQTTASSKLMVAQLQSDLLPGRVVDEEGQRAVHGLGPSGVSDLIIGLNTQVAAALSSVDQNVSPVDFDASLGAALDLAIPTEQQMVQLAGSVSFLSVLPLQQALDDLRIAWLDLHTAVSSSSMGNSGCQTTLDACALVPLADAEALLGTTDITAPPLTGSLPEPPPGLQESSICEYHTLLTRTHNGLVYAYVLRFTDAHSAEVGMGQFQQADGPPFTAVAGVGDAAARASAQLPDNIGAGRMVFMIVRRGTILLQVTAGVLPDVGPADLDAAVQQVVEKALTKLGP